MCKKLQSSPLFPINSLLTGHNSVHSLGFAKVASLNTSLPSRRQHPPICQFKTSTQYTIPAVIIVPKSVSDGLIRRKPSESFEMDQNNSSYHHSKALELLSLNNCMKATVQP
ncbi:hypothetical protein Y032_0015g2875 [Ancylostoma ceylanicum]|uniref:Uncharacterized protein n=1 Tax=Ancylostoma ceylanicum TaxID=53326 RepID=A0A016V8T2_9BILA|nr:hypothetical protein Y032_0015g2875 [Ancylostoma ceylanicum]